MLSFCLVWCTFAALGDPFSSTTAFRWSLNWSLNRNLTVFCFFAFNEITLPHNHGFNYSSEEAYTKNIVGKGGNADNQNYLLFLQCFLPCQKQISTSKSYL